MTTRYTDDEWEEMIRDVAQTVGDEVGETKHGWEGPFTKTIDHTLLKLDATASQIDELCAEAKACEFATVCVRPNWVHHCAANLHGTTIRIASVIGFPEGTHATSHKLRETHDSLTAGALELDVVLNYPQLLARHYAAVADELTALRAVAPRPVALKLILETSQLSRADIVAACVLAGAAGWDYVKTSTGFRGAGATVENVRLMRRCCEVLGDRGGGGGTVVMRVKASGGIRSFEDAVGMLEAGASRLGTSGGVRLAEEFRERGEGGGGAAAAGGGGRERVGEEGTSSYADY